MSLKLKYEPTPENAARFADDIVQVARDVSGAELDYSVNSLSLVDEIIDGFAQDGCQVDDVKETLFEFGCYVGEVFVRNAAGRWRAPLPGVESEVFGFPLVVELAPDNVCNPIGKVFKRLDLGESENLPYFYSVFAHSAGAEARKTTRPWWKRVFNST